MRGCRIGAALAALIAFGTVLAGTAVAGGSVQLTIDYSGVYTFQTTSFYHGAVAGTVDQKYGWTWHVQGEPHQNGGLTLLRGQLQVTGTRDDTSTGIAGAAAGSTHCTYDAGSQASAPIGASQYLGDVKYGTGIPGADSTCDGVNDGPGDPLACDFNGCATVCTDPPAVSTADKFTTPVSTAFKPTTDYTSKGSVFLGEGYLGFGTETTPYDLPPQTGKFDGDCGNSLTESGAMTITSQVTASILDTRDGFTINFPDGVWPDLGRPIDLLDYPAGPHEPNFIVPPETGEPPEVTLPPPATPAVAVVGVIEIGCPRSDRRCRGAVSVTGPGGALGSRSYDVAGRHDALVAVPLASRVRAALERAGSVAVRVRVNAVTTPGNRHFHAGRTVRLIAYKPVTGAPAPQLSRPDR